MVNDSDNEGEEHFGNGFHEKPSSPNAYVNEGFSDFPLTCTPVVSQNDVSAVYEENPKIKQVGLRSILNYARWWDYIFLVVAIFASIGLGIGMPLLIILFGDIIDEMIEPGTEDFLNQTNAFKQFEDTMTDVCLQITYVGLGVLLVAYFQIAYITLFGENILYRIRCDSFKAVIRQEIAWFDYQKTGLLVTKLAENMETIRIGVSDKIAIAIQHLTTFVAGFVIAFMYNAEFAGVLCVLIPFMLVAGIGMAKASESVASEEQVEHGDAGALAESTFSAIRTVIAFGGEKRAIKRYDECLSKAKYKAASKTIIIGAFLGFVFLVEFLGYGLAFWYGPRLVVDGELKGGEMMTVFFCVLVGSLSLGQGITAFISVWSVRGAMSYIQFIMNRVPLIDSETDKGVKLDSIKGEMHFSNINFCYPSRRDVPVLKNFNLTVKPGQKVALVGASGSGKSTIVNLIQRFYEYNNGSITLDGRDLKELNVKWLREQIGVVSQEPSLFACSIKENIQYGREGVTDDEIKDALEKANAKNFIDKLPNGLDTVVGDRGSQLSGGQKQRVAIARALVRNPKILLLDEATSALDSSSESVVQEALDKASAGRTTLIVAHRLSTIRDADLIVAMEHGQVVEMGTHSELLNKHGLYANLVTAQTLSETDSQEADEDLDQVECVGDTEGNEANHVVYNRRDEVAVHIKDGGTLDPDLVPESPKKKKTGGKKDKKEKEETPGFLDIMRLNAPEWYLLLIACIFAIPAAGGIPIYGIFFAEIIEVFALPADEIQEEANFWAGMFCVLGCAVGFGIFFESVFLGLSGARLTQRLRSNSFKQILRQDMTFFDKEENYVGQLTTRLTKETAQIQGASGFRLKAIVEATVGLLTGLVIAFIFGWQLAFLVLGMIPFIGLSAGLQLKFASGFAVTGKDAEKGEARIISESISNIRTVQSLNLETQLSKLFVSYLTETHKKNLIMAHVFGVAQCVSQGMFFFVFAACFRFAAWLVVEDQISFSDAFRVIFSLVFAAYGVGQSMSVVPDYDKAKNSALSVTKLLKLRSNIDNLSHEGEQLKKKVEEIEFRDVHFRYPSRPKVKILRGLNLSIKKGTTVALVGASGCGKSTVMQLLQRFYDPEHGEVLIDGQNIKHLNVQDLRKKMAIVSQEPTLFNASISDNIRYGALADNGDFDPALVYSDVEAAAKKANMWTYDYVLSLPEKLETNVGDKGTQLSGGQKQRVAIARALLRNPEILLLDEATSALDSRSEKLVQTAIDEARVGRTCLVIAHRLTTIQAADEIVVMDQGHVAERGTHEKLIAQGGLYKQFCDAQSLK